LLLEEEELELLQSRSRRHGQIQKQVLDEAVAAAILGCNPKITGGTISNTSLCFTACLLPRNFAQLRFPDVRVRHLGVCGTAYFVLFPESCSLRPLLMSSILLTLPLPEADGKAVKTKDMLATGLRVTISTADSQMNFWSRSIQQNGSWE
jgi:hypothetical protein